MSGSYYRLTGSMRIILGRGEVTIESGWVSQTDSRRAIFIEPSDQPGTVGDPTGASGGLKPLKKGGLMLIIENVSGAKVLRDTLNELINEIES